MQKVGIPPATLHLSLSPPDAEQVLLAAQEDLAAGNRRGRDDWLAHLVFREHLELAA